MPTQSRRERRLKLLRRARLRQSISHPSARSVFALQLLLIFLGLVFIARSAEQLVVEEARSELRVVRESQLAALLGQMPITEVCRYSGLVGAVRLRVQSSDGRELCDSSGVSALVEESLEVQRVTQEGPEKNVLLADYRKSQSLTVGMQLKISAVLAGVTLLLGVVSVLLTRLVAQPLEVMRIGAERLARGQFERKLPSFRIRETADLSSAMNRMGAQLQDLERIRRDFVANVSHELKTPITSIQGFVETLIDGAMDNREDLVRFLGIIQKQSERMTIIIQDLLALARLESERTSELLKLQNERLHALLSAAIELCKSRADERGIRLRLECPPTIEVMVDRSLIEQAIINLLDNAIKYSFPNSEVLVRGVETGANAEIEIIDHGPGIPTEHIPRLFERFYRVDKARSREFGGTGLGLAIVKHVAGVHGGAVEVVSEVGQGTTFSLVLKRHLEV